MVYIYIHIMCTHEYTHYVYTWIYTLCVHMNIHIMCTHEYIYIHIYIHLHIHIHIHIYIYILCAYIMLIYDIRNYYCFFTYLSLLTWFFTNCSHTSNLLPRPHWTNFIAWRCWCRTCPDIARQNGGFNGGSPKVWMALLWKILQKWSKMFKWMIWG